MSREEMVRDLLALAERFSEGWHDGIKIDALDIELLADAARALAEQPAPPPECQTEAEKTAFAFGWWKALEAQPAQQEPVAIVDANDEGYWAEILPDRSVQVGQLLYTSPLASKPLTDKEKKT